MKLTDYVVEFLREKGIHDFFGYQGTMIAHFVDSIEKNPGTKSHSCYNEQGAAFAACGYAQAKGDCACAYATSGPGAVNLLSGVADAYFDSLPVLFITGQLNTYEYSGIPGLRQQGFQEVDIVSMAKPVTKYAVQIREPEDILQELPKAWETAVTGRKGPVLIDLPMNVQRAEVHVPGNTGGKAAETGVPENAGGKAAERAAAAVRDALSVSARPAILLGQGIGRESRQRLVSLAEKWKLPVITSVLAKDTMPFDHPMNFGCIGGAYGHRCANMIANAKADLLICLGISLCTRQIGTKVHEFARGAQLLRVDIDSYNLQREIHENREREATFRADGEEVIQRLCQGASVPPGDWDGWFSRCRRIREELREVDDAVPERWPNRMIAGLSRCLKDVSAIAVDVGQHMVWCYQSLENSGDQRLLFSGGHGAMGYALPAAIGAFYATGRPVACICGDGAFQMNIQELQWVKRENIPIKMIVMNNQALGMIRHLQKDYFDSVYADTTAEAGGFTSCSFAEVAGGYGIRAMSLRADPSAGLSGAAEFLSGSGPQLLEIRMESDTFAYPKTCLGEPIHNQQPYIPADVFERLMSL